MFILLPILAFLFGMNYQKQLQVLTQPEKIVISPIQTPTSIVNTVAPHPQLLCKTASDCIFAVFPGNNCPIAINKNYAGNYQYTCTGNQGYFGGPDCAEVGKKTAQCSWSLMGCPGKPGINCVQGICKVGPCGIP